MVLVLFGDTHELHREVEVPPGDILICVGDFTMFSKSLSAIEDFNEWLGELPHRHKIVVPGNHEFFLESNPERRSLLDNANVLIDEGIEIEGLSIYGSPMTPLLGTAFGKSSPNDRARLWSKVPNDTHVLVTHGPPFGILDLPLDQAERMGDPSARLPRRPHRPALSTPRSRQGTRASHRRRRPAPRRGQLLDAAQARTLPPAAAPQPFVQVRASARHF